MAAEEALEVQSVCLEVHVCILVLEGELDLSGADRLAAAAAGVAEETVVMDLSGLEFLDAAGLGALLAAKRVVEGRGGRYQLRGAHGLVRRVFDAVALSHLLED